MSMELGEEQFLTTWGSVTLEPIKLKFGIIDYVRHTKYSRQHGFQRTANHYLVHYKHP